ncbi:MAG TPA: ABC transporter permease [Gemmatimonadaceae bacterium]|nr:ABC transporter permease [Gemmatimonadaceae bacterium]
MSHTKGFLARLRGFFSPRAADRRMEEEFAFHVEMEAARLRAEGTPPELAQQQALARFGGVERYRQEMREGRRANWFHDLRDDLRYGTRMLVRQRGLTIIAIFSLAVGIGANAAIFSIVNSMLLQPRPFREPDQLVQLYYGDRQQPYQTSSYPVYLDFRERNHVFSGLAAYGLGHQFRLGMPDDVRFVWGEVVSGNYFDVLGIRPHLGRMFLPEEDSVAGRNPVVVVGFALWQRDFGADSSIIGRSIRLNDQPVTVVGVAPMQYGGMITGWSSDLWIPAMTMAQIGRTGDLRINHRGSKWVTLVGRLKPGVTLEQARSDTDALAAGMRAEHPGDWRDPNRPERERFMTVVPERQARVPPQLRLIVQGVAALLFVVVNLVLVIACMNLAGLLFARAVARRSEIGVRLALGAGRFRIIRQLLTESVLLAFVAGIAGLLLATWALDVLIASIPALPEGIRVSLDIGLDWWVVAYTLGFATLTGVLFGLAPAIQSSRSSLMTVLKDDQLAFAGKSRPSRSRRLLIVGQVAASVLLLIGAGLMSRSLGNIRPTRLGFTTDNFLVASLRLDERTHDQASAARSFEQMSAAVAGLPGVQHVSLVDAVPGGFLSRTRGSTEVEGYVPRPGEDMEIDRNIVGPGYFTNMKIPFVLGRDFTAQDREGAPCVAIINDVFASRYLGGPGTAIGKHIARYRAVDKGRPSMCAIVGVVRDAAWQSLQEEPRPFFNLTYLQLDRREMTMMVGTSGDPEPVAASVRRALRDVEPSMPVDVRTLTDAFSVSLFPFKLFGMVLVAGGLMALLLATIGIYGTVSYAVAQRRREVGIRMALGAVRSDILRVVVGQGMRVVVYGLAIGLFLGILLTLILSTLPIVSSLLFGISVVDVATFVGVTLLLGGVALVACYIPALRAAKVDPVVTLRGL